MIAHDLRRPKKAQSIRSDSTASRSRVAAATFIAATVAVVLITTWALAPTWRRILAARALVAAGYAQDDDRLLAAVERMESLQDSSLIDHVLGLLEHPHPGVRRYAVIAIPTFHRKPNAAVPLLAAILENPSEDTRVRAAAASALGYFGKDAQDVVDTLNRALHGGEGALYPPARQSLLDLCKEGVDIPLEVQGVHDPPLEPGATARQITSRILSHVEDNAYPFLKGESH